VGLLATIRKAIGPSVINGPPVTNPVVVWPDGVIDKGWGAEWWQRGWRGQWRGGLPIVEACISAYAQTIAQCCPEHKRQRADGGTDTITNSALATLLRRPNDYQTSSDFFLNLERSIQAAGNGYVYTPRAGGDPTAMHVLNPRKVRVVRAFDDYETYWYKLDASNPSMVPFDPTLYLLPREMLHVRINADEDPLVGVSPLQHAHNALNLNRQIGSSLSHFYANMSRPAGVLSTDERLTKEQTTKLREAFENQAKGMETGGVPILTNGLKWVPLGYTAQEAEVIAAYKESVVDIARVFRVPLQMINELENATLNNAETLINHWLSTGLGFAINHIELAFDAHFDLPRGDYTEFDTDVLMRTDTPARLDALAKAVLGGIYSPNEARAKEGLPTAAYGDEPRLQRQNVPLSAYAQEAALAQQQADTAEAKADAAKIAADAAADAAAAAAPATAAAASQDAAAAAATASEPDADDPAAKQAAKDALRALWRENLARMTRDAA
jgi:HK97 family phage portal protein